MGMKHEHAIDANNIQTAQLGKDGIVTIKTFDPEAPVLELKNVTLQAIQDAAAERGVALHLVSKTNKLVHVTALRTPGMKTSKMVFGSTGLHV
ncbi:MAG TPA: hypothetical protein DCY07_04930 [Rhodospirillaceae bacterium]|nr:hypothetical protein [Rhodospirillaceae bacterium]